VTTVAETIVTALGDLGVRTVWGVVGDALNPVTEAIRKDDRLRWIGTRHEEAAAFAASAQAQLTGTLGVCMGTVGPGSIHLLNGLYDASKSHAPVLAICGQVPLAEMGGDYFQEVDNDLLFADVAAFRHTITSPTQLPRILQQAVNAAYARPGVAVLTLPGDVGSMALPKETPAPRFVTSRPILSPDPASIAAAAQRIDDATKVTLLVGIGARQARDQVLALAAHLQAPMVLTLKAKEGLERENPYQIGQSGLIGNPASKQAFDDADLLLMLGTDFPYPDWLPAGTTTIQVDTEPAHIGRRLPVDVGVVSDVGAAVTALRGLIKPKTDDAHVRSARSAYQSWHDKQQSLADPAFDSTLVGRARSALDNRHHLIRPEAVAATLDRLAADDAIFTTDTGMATVWLSRFVELRGTRRLLGSYNLGSMANAMPHALGAADLDRGRQVVAFCGDGGLTMLLGDLLTAVAYRLPVKLVVFNNGRLGMVKLEQEQGGLPEFGTELANPDLAVVATAMGLTGIRVEDPHQLEDAVRTGLATDGPVLLDIVTNPDEIALPPKATVDQAWGFAIAKLKEGLRSSGT